MTRNASPALGLLLAAALPAWGLSGLGDAADVSQRAAAARSPEEARDWSYAALEGGDQAREAVAAETGEPLKRARPAAGTPIPLLPAEAGPLSKPTIAERRAEMKGKGKPGKTLRAAGYGTLGFLGGLVLGWLIGAAVAGAFVVKAPNPALKNWKWALLLPAVVLGAAVGAVAGPIIGAKVFSEAEPYDAKGVPDGKP